FNPYPVKNISTMATSSAGTPPYQLGCGNAAPTTIGSSDNDTPRIVGKSMRVSNHRHLKSSRSVKNTKHVGKSKSYAKSKPASKNKHVIKATSVNKNKKSIGKIKPVKTHYHHS
ncbi:MAG: hypothetical protein WCP96_08325, partial [Methylococcaceae bacterium]